MNLIFWSHSLTEMTHIIIALRMKNFKSYTIDSYQKIMRILAFNSLAKQTLPGNTIRYICDFRRCEK